MRVLSKTSVRSYNNWVGPKVNRKVQQKWWIDLVVLQNKLIDSVYFCATCFPFVLSFGHFCPWISLTHKAFDELYQYSILLSDRFILVAEIVASVYFVVIYYYSILNSVMGILSFIYIHMKDISYSILHIPMFQLYSYLSALYCGINLRSLLPLLYFGYMGILHVISLSMLFPFIIYMEFDFFIGLVFIWISGDWRSFIS